MGCRLWRVKGQGLKAFSRIILKYFLCLWRSEEDAFVLVSSWGVFSESQMVGWALIPMCQRWLLAALLFSAWLLLSFPWKCCNLGSTHTKPTSGQVWHKRVELNGQSAEGRLLQMIVDGGTRVSKLIGSRIKAEVRNKPMLSVHVKWFRLGILCEAQTEVGVLHH